MDWFHHLADGFSVASTAPHLALGLLGGLLGLFIGSVRGVGLVTAIALLLPLMGALDALSSLILLAGVQGGAQCGALTVRTLLSPSPGSVWAVAGMDGHQLARQGRAGMALVLASLSGAAAAFFAIALMFVAAPLWSALAGRFGSAEFFSFLVLSLVGAVALSPGSLVKAVAMALLGLLLSQVGAAQASRLFEHAFGVPEVFSRLHFVVLAIGLFAFGEVIASLGQPQDPRQPLSTAPGALRPTPQEWRQARPALARGAIWGTLMGWLPGAGPVLAALGSHAMERRLAGPAGAFGRGDVRGVAGPAAAWQAGAPAAFLPLLTWGIPLNAAMALMVGAVSVKEVTLGPQAIALHPDLLWGLIAALALIQGLLLLVNVPLMRWWAQVLCWPYRFVFPVVTLMGCLGVYVLRGSVFDVYLAAGLAVAGYVFHKLRCPVAPLLLGFMLGPWMEANLRATLQLGDGWRSLVAQPVSAGLLLAALALLVFVLLPSTRRPRETAFKEDA